MKTKREEIKEERNEGKNRKRGRPSERFLCSEEGKQGEDRETGQRQKRKEKRFMSG